MKRFVMIVAGLGLAVLLGLVVLGHFAGDTAPDAERAAARATETAATETAATETAATEGDAVDPADVPAFPSADEQVAMLDRAFEDFVTSLEAKSMAHFRGTTSSIWQQQFPLEAFEQNFAGAYELQEPFTRMRVLVPAVAPVTTVSERGELQLVGIYDTEPPVRVEANYIVDDAAWKLSGFHFGAQ